MWRNPNYVTAYCWYEMVWMKRFTTVPLDVTSSANLSKLELKLLWNFFAYAFEFDKLIVNCVFLIGWTEFWLNLIKLVSG